MKKKKTKRLCEKRIEHANQSMQNAKIYDGKQSMRIILNSPLTNIFAVVVAVAI